MRNRSTIFTFSAIAALSLFAVSCKKSGNAAPPMRPPPAVTANQPVQKEVTEWDDFPGRLEAVDMVEIKARVSGYLQSINFKDGAEVKKGDLLFVIDPRQYQAELDRAEANLKQATSRLELAANEKDRAERLLKSKAISEEEADSRIKGQSEAEAAVQSARAAVESAKLNLEYTRITAPIDGRIGRKMMTQGNLVNGNQGQSSTLATIVSVDPVYAYFDADENAILKYQQLRRENKVETAASGMGVCELELSDESGYPHKGVLDFMDNMVNPSTGTLRVRGVFSNPDFKLQPGFFARVRVPGSGKYPAILIPEEAIGTDQGQKFVYVVNDKDTIEYHSVKLGPIIEGLRVVREGVKPTDWIVVNGLMSVRPDVKVAATRAPQGAAPAAGAAPAPAETKASK